MTNIILHPTAKRQPDPEQHRRDMQRAIANIGLELNRLANRLTAVAMAAGIEVDEVQS